MTESRVQILEVIKAQSDFFQPARCAQKLRIAVPLFRYNEGIKKRCSWMHTGSFKITVGAICVAFVSPDKRLFPVAALYNRVGTSGNYAKHGKLSLRK